MNPRAKRNAATMSHTVTFENPERPSWTVNSRSSMPSAMTMIIIDPAGIGRVMSEQIVAAKRQRRPQLRGGKPACGIAQFSAATRKGAAQRHRSGRSGTFLYSLPMRILPTILALAAAATAGAGFQAQAPDPGTTATVERAGRYVETYLDAFSAVVSEEHQIQRLVRPDGRVKKVRELKSDFLLVKVGTGWPQAFRDVMEVDGKPVQNRSDRLRKLFLENPKTAVELARAIAKEGGRFNIGLHRAGNSPLLPLIFLVPRVASGVRYATSGPHVTFEEFRSPSVLGARTLRGRHDLMAHGVFELEPETGRVLAAEFTAAGEPGRPSASTAVRYQKDAKLNLDVPVDVKDRYWWPSKPGDDRLEVESTYSAFRRFDVTTGEQIKIPK